MHKRKHDGVRVKEDEHEWPRLVNAWDEVLINTGIRETRWGMRPRFQGRLPITLKLSIAAANPRTWAAHCMARSRSLSFWELSHGSKSWREKRIKEEAYSAASQRTDRYSWTWLQQSIRVRLLTAGPLLPRGRLCGSRTRGLHFPAPNSPSSRC